MNQTLNDESIDCQDFSILVSIATFLAVALKTPAPPVKVSLSKIQKTQCATTGQVSTSLGSLLPLSCM